MKLFETFNFDIIIILVLIASVLLGAYHSLYRQARKTVVLAFPFVILYFAFDSCMKFLNSIPFYAKIQDRFFSFLAGIFGLEMYKDTLNIIIAYIISYTVLAFALRLLYGLIRIPTYKKVLNKPSAFSRVIGSLLGLINGYIIILLIMYGVKPIINIDYNRSFSGFITETNNEVIVISQLNQYQNVNVDAYDEYQESIDIFTGRRVYDDYSKIIEFLNNLNQTNIYLKEAIVPVLSEESKALIPSETDDLVRVLLGNLGEKPLFQTILKNEKKNGQYALIKEMYDYLMMHQAYIGLTELSEAELEFPSLFIFLKENSDAFSGKFTELRWRNRFSETLATYDYYQNHFEGFRAFLNDQTEADDLESLVGIFEVVIQDNSRLRKLADDFILAHEGTDDPIIHNLLTVFKKTVKYWDNIQLLPEAMSLSSKIIFAKDYKEWFEKQSWKNHILLSSYLKDVITSSESGGNSLYHEYFFYKYLAGDYVADEPLDINDITEIFTRMDLVVSEGLLTEEDARDYINCLFLNENSAFYRFAEDGRLSPTMRDDLLTLENQYLSSELKEKIPNF